MKSLYLGLIANLFLTLATCAQSSWTNRFNGTGNGDDQLRAAAVDSVGNVYVAGYTTGNGTGLDFIVLKYSGGGLPLWTNWYSGPGVGADQVNAVAVDAEDSLFVSGYSIGSTGQDFTTIKYSADGAALWTNYYNGPGNGADQATAIAVDGDGSVYVAGFSTGAGSAQDFLFLKYSNAGTALWTNRYNGPGNGTDQIKAIAVDAVGNVFVTGSSVGSSSGADYATLAYSGAGIPLWTNRYNGVANGADQANAIALDASGNVFVTGTSSGAGDDYVTVAYSNAGMPLWTNRFSGAGSNADQATAVAVDLHGNVFVTGSSFRVGTAEDYLTIKYSNSGTALWTNSYNGAGNFSDLSLGLVLDRGGNVLVTGQSFGGVATSWDVVTISYSNDGALLWTNRYNGLGSYADRPFAIVADADNNVIVAGYSYSGSSASSSDCLVLKYVSAAVLPAAVLGDPKMVANGFSFELIAEPGSQFQIQATTNLVEWEAVRQVTIPAGGSTNIVEPLSSGAGQKYYRAQRQ